MIYPLPRAMSPDLGACARHVQQAGVSREADRQLAEVPYSWVQRPVARCHHCQEPMLYARPTGHPLWCHTCERERLQIAERGDVA